MKPTLQALVLADNIYRDAETGKHVIAGTFNRVVRHKEAAREGVSEDGTRETVRRVRPRAGSPDLYINITNVRRPTTLTLRFVNLDDNRAIFQIQFPVTTADPLQTVEAIIKLPPLPFREPGVYALELLHDDDPLGCLRITADDEADSSEV